MFFSIIIPTCNRPQLLKKCLEKLLPETQDYLSNYEIIITDDSQDTETKDFLQREYKGIVYKKGPRNGIGANRNNGASIAKGEWLIFIDDDTIPTPQILNNYNQAIKDNQNCLAFEGCILPDNPNMMESEFADCPVNYLGGNFWTANVCINKSLFKKIGGFDESLKFFHEDQDIYIRLKTITPVFFVKDSIVHHPVKLITLKGKLLRANKSFNDYLTFKNKQKNTLQIIKEAYHFHFVSLLGNLKKRRKSDLILNIYQIFYLIPFKTFIFITKKNLNN